MKGIKSDPNLPLITLKNQKKHWYGYPTFPIIKIRDSRTTMIEFPDRLTVNQGIWIDVVPLDPIPPFQTERQTLNFEIAKLLLLATVHPDTIKQLMQNGKKFILSHSDLNNFLSLSFHDKGMNLDNFLFENFAVSSQFGELDRESYAEKQKLSMKTKWFDDVEYLPFENIKVAAPIGWEDFLTTQYGDWRTPKIFYTHEVTTWSADIPYDEYYKKIVQSNR